MTTAIARNEYHQVPLPEVGTRLRNGAWCLAAKEGRRPGMGEVPCNVVLAFHSGAGCVQPFATWIVRPGGVCIWGHYFESVFDAVADYAERS